MTDNAPIQLERITKVFRHAARKETRALDDVSLSLGQGEIFSLLGPNGAGKTTLARLLLGFVYPTAGRISINGTSPADPRSRCALGYLPESPDFPPHLTVSKVLQYCGAFRNLDPALTHSRIAGLTERLRIRHKLEAQVRSLSKGMKIRLAFATALVHEPNIILLDEPSDGLDPEGRIEVRSLLAELKQKGKTILINSHLLSEAERFSDRVGLLKEGRLLRLDEMKTIVGGRGLHVVEVRTTDETLLAEIRKSFVVDRNGASWLIRVPEPEKLKELLSRLQTSPAFLVGINQEKHSLEDYYLRQMGYEGRT